ncbi:MAG: M4 family peptidase [Lysobacteraceae bacterium]|nr:MAG: M4 family peptidase [Xanthomonadaceae bacterium]
MSLLSLAIASGLAMSGSADAAGNQRSAAIARANALIAAPAANAALRRANADSFVARDAVVDADGTEHVRYQRNYHGLPVIGGDFVVQSRNGKVGKVSQTLKTTARPALKPVVTADQAIVEAGSRFGSHFQGAPSARLVVYARGASPVLAHEVVFKGIKADQTETEMHYFVDARSGKLLDQWDRVQTAQPGPGGSACNGATAAVGSGKSLTAGNVVLNTTKCGTSYRMVDMTRGGGMTHNMSMKTAGMGAVFTGSVNTWGNFLVGNAQTAAADAHYGVATTWDYYKNMHGRLGIANDGQGAISRVHYGRNYANASWSDGCFCMTFGDGDNGATILPLVALDIAGHEMSHGVTSRSAGLIYSGESGGLNEGTSDIFGTLVEYYANNASDPGDYVIGEELFANNANMRQAIRFMFKPSLEGAGTSQDCYGPTTGSVDVHYSSGVANHFFYLLAEGAVVPAGFGAGSWANLTPAALVCNGNTAIAGIGREAAGKIWYRALTVYMTSSTNYAGARVATISASTDLYGGASAQTNAVKAAWSAVSVN